MAKGTKKAVGRHALIKRHNRVIEIQSTYGVLMVGFRQTSTIPGRLASLSSHSAVATTLVGILTITILPVN